MPSLIPNYIARLRTHSQSTAASSSSHSGSRSNSTAGPSTPGTELARLAEDPVAQPESNPDKTPQSPAIARKIHPDLSTLLDENALPETGAEALGPRPPRGRSRSAEQLARMRPESVPEHATEIQNVSSTNSPTADVSTPPRPPFLSRILSAPLLGGVTSTPPPTVDAEPGSGRGGAPWSTFGRRRSRMAAVGELGSLHRRGSGSKGSAQSKTSQRRSEQKSTPVTPTTTRPPSTRTSVLSHAQTGASNGETPSSQNDSPVGTLSSSSGSKSYSTHSHSVRSRRPHLPPEPILDTKPARVDPQTPAPVPTPLFSSPASQFTPSPVIASPRPTRPTLDDSPHTFGRPTPKRRGTSSRPYPGLGAAFLPPLTSTPPPLEHHRQNSTREPPSTFPPRKSKRPISGSSISFPSLPSAASRPTAEDVFQTGDHERRPSGLLLPGGNGGSSGRRTSADWSAAEAARNRGGGEVETWPATVSREMVRLSLASGGGGAAGEDGAEMSGVGALREGSNKNPTLFGSVGEDRRRFLRAGRKRAGLDPSTPAIASSSSPSHATLAPAFSVSPPFESGPSLDPARSEGGRGGGLAPHVSVTAPTPSASPSGSQMGILSDPNRTAHPGATDKSLDPRAVQSPGKRKIIDTEDEQAVDESGRKLNTSILSSSREPSNHLSDASRAPSSFRQPKRIRLSTPSNSPEHPSRSQSHTHSLNSPHQSPPASPPSRPSSSLRAHSINPRSVSQSSIPLRAIVSPHPPSIDRRSTYHMRDPTLPPPRRQSAQWAGSARKREEGRRVFPLQGWAFIAGFLLFPVWWFAAIAPVGWGWGWKGKQDGKGAWMAEEDLAAMEVLEYDVAYTWRRRCRLMSLLGLLLYVPLIVLLAVLVPRT